MWVGRHAKTKKWRCGVEMHAPVGMNDGCLRPDGAKPPFTRYFLCAAKFGCLTGAANITLDESLPPPIPERTLSAPPVNEKLEFLREFFAAVKAGDDLWQYTTDECVFAPPGIELPIADFQHMMQEFMMAFPTWDPLVHDCTDNGDGTYTVETQQVVGLCTGDLPAVGPFPAVAYSSAPAHAKANACVLPTEVGQFTFVDGKVAKAVYTGALGEERGATTMHITPPVGMMCLYQWMGLTMDQLTPPPAEPEPEPEMVTLEDATATESSSDPPLAFTDRSTFKVSVDGITEITENVQETFSWLQLQSVYHEDTAFEIEFWEQGSATTFRTWQTSSEQESKDILNTIMAIHSFSMNPVGAPPTPKTYDLRIINEAST
jgi:hypothetical protein